VRKLFGQIALVLFLLCFGTAFAQQVVYSLKDGSGQPLGRMVFHYKPNGYEATMNGEKLSVEVSGNTATATIGKLIITMPVDGSYYHNRVGLWRTTPVTTTFGDRGVAKMFYAGMVPNGRLYREELWMNGRLFYRSETVVDHNDQIVWSVATDAQGTLWLTRI
jgi:hypothetical protein